MDEIAPVVEYEDLLGVEVLNPIPIWEEAWREFTELLADL